MKLSLFNEAVTRTTGTLLLFFLAGGTCLAGAKEYTVAADGSGDFRTLQAALAAVPDDNPNRIVFHIRPGVYQGQIILPASKPNV
ncbi:MAG TPA: pectinesterase family protein, partial [Verrucomicrobiae bacterium]|nr:pectinesterase family protein [Verrucomicrobiae bacterium]